MGIFDKANGLFSKAFGRENSETAGYAGGGRTGYFPPVTKQRKQPVSGTVRTKSNPAQPTVQQVPQGQAQQAFFNTNLTQGMPAQQQYPGMGTQTRQQMQPQYPTQNQNGFTNQQSTGYQPQNQYPTAAQPKDDTGFGRAPQQSAVQVSNTDYYTQQTPSQFQGYTDDLGRMWKQRTNVMCLTGLRECYDCIDGMSGGQTVIVNLERIQDDREKQRCMDLLTGAAYVLGCRTTQVNSAKEVFVFSAGNVYLYLDRDVTEMNSRQHFSRNESQQQPSQGGRTYGFNRSRYA